MNALSALLLLSTTLSTTMIAAQFLAAPKVVRVEAFGSEPNSQVLEMGGYSKENQYFVPDSVTIFEGDSVLWFWKKGGHNVQQVHNETSIEQLRDTHGTRGFGIDVSESGEFFWTFRKAGTYHYVCDPHIRCCDMRGVVIVLPRPSDLAPLEDAPGAINPSPTDAPPITKATRSFLDDLVLGSETLATDRVDGPPAPITTVAVVDDHKGEMVNGDDEEHRVTVDVPLVNPHANRDRFSRTTFVIVLILVGALFVTVLLCLSRQQYAKNHRPKAQVVMHTSNARLDA